MAKKKRRTVPRLVPEDLGSDIEDRDEALQPDLTEAQRNRKVSGEARAARDRDNTYHGRKCKLAHLIDHLPQELWDAFLDDAVQPRVEAISERAVLASLLFGLLVRGLFTIHVADPLGLHDQPVYTDIPVSQAAIPDLSCRNLFLQLVRGLPGNGANTQPNAAVAAVLAAHPDLRDRLAAIPRHHSDGNMVDHVGKQLETAFSNMLTVLFTGRLKKSLIKQAKQRWPDRVLALAYGAAGFSGSGSIGCRGVPVSQMLKEALRQFPAGRVLMVDEFRTSRVSSAYSHPSEALPGQPPESFRWLRPVYSEQGCDYTGVFHGHCGGCAANPRRHWATQKAQPDRPAQHQHTGLVNKPALCSAVTDASFLRPGLTAAQQQRAGSIRAVVLSPNFWAENELMLSTMRPVVQLQIDLQSDNANNADAYYGQRVVHQWYQQQASSTEAVRLSPISSPADWVLEGIWRNTHVSGAWGGFKSGHRQLIAPIGGLIRAEMSEKLSPALNIRRCAVGPGPRPTELCYWDGRPALPKPGRPGQEWVYLRDKALLRKVAVVTGANSGIGYEATRKLAENGAEVYMVVRNMEKGQDALEKITKELGSVKLHLLHADMECMSQVQRAAQQLRSIKVDILINNAGVLCPGPFRMTQEGLEQTLAIDFYSAALLALGTIDCMAQGGRIVFVSSEAEWPLGAFASFDNMRGDKFKDSGITPYAVAKVWEIMFAKELAERVRHKGIDVFAVHPGKGFGYFGPNLLGMLRMSLFGGPLSTREACVDREALARLQYQRDLQEAREAARRTAKTLQSSNQNSKQPPPAAEPPPAPVLKPKKESDSDYASAFDDLDGTGPVRSKTPSLKQPTGSAGQTAPRKHGRPLMTKAPPAPPASAMAKGMTAGNGSAAKAPTIPAGTRSNGGKPTPPQPGPNPGKPAMCTAKNSKPYSMQGPSQQQPAAKQHASAAQQQQQHRSQQQQGQQQRPGMAPHGMRPGAPPMRAGGGLQGTQYRQSNGMAKGRPRPSEAVAIDVAVSCFVLVLQYDLDEYEDDFVVDEDDEQELDWRSAVRKVTGYDPRKYSAADDDDRNMEVSFQQIAAEERRSAKLGKVAVVTGANSGIGYEATRKLAENGAEVYMVVRNMEKGRDALEKITKELGPVKLHLLHTDLESMSQVQALIAKLQGVKIDILINNAGVFFPGPFRLLTLGLLEQMTAKSRIVFMSSEGEWPLAQVEASFKNIKPALLDAYRRGDTLKESGPVAYGTSKAYEIMFARELAARLRHRDIDVFAVQPGAWSTLFTATDPSLTGRLFEETVKVLENIVGSKAMPPVPRHPDESRGAASLKGNIRSTTDKSNQGCLQLVQLRLSLINTSISLGLSLGLSSNSLCLRPTLASTSLFLGLGLCGNSLGLGLGLSSPELLPIAVAKSVCEAQEHIAAGLGLKGGLHLLTAALRNVRPPKKSIGKHQVTLREAVLDVATYTVFLGTMGAVYVSVEEALALLFGQDRTSQWRALVAGAVAGHALLITGSQARHHSLATYVLLRGITLLVRCGNKVPPPPAASCTAAVTHPRQHRPAAGPHTSLAASNVSCPTSTQGEAAAINNQGPGAGSRHQDGKGPVPGQLPASRSRASAFLPAALGQQEIQPPPQRAHPSQHHRSNRQHGDPASTANGGGGGSSESNNSSSSIVMVVEPHSAPNPGQGVPSCQSATGSHLHTHPNCPNCLHPSTHGSKGSGQDSGASSHSSSSASLSLSPAGPVGSVQLAWWRRVHSLLAPTRWRHGDVLLMCAASAQVGPQPHQCFSACWLHHQGAYKVLCCAVLCCVALRCAVLRCAVLRCAALRCAVLCCAVLCCAVLCCAVLRCAALRCAALRCAALCCAVLAVWPPLSTAYVPSLPHPDPCTSGYPLSRQRCCLQIVYSFIMQPSSLPPSYIRFIMRQAGKEPHVWTAVREQALRNWRLLGLGLHVPPTAQALLLGQPLTPCEFWHPGQSCLEHTLTNVPASYARALAVYVPVYLVPALLVHRQKLASQPQLLLPKLAQGIGRSALFLTAFIALAFGSVCAGFAVTGVSSGPLIAACTAAGGLAVLLEKKSRRMELALYCLSRAAESSCRCLVEWGWLPSALLPRRLDVMLFAAGCAAIMHCYSVPAHSDGAGQHRDVFRSKYLNVLDFIFGNSGPEGPDNDILDCDEALQPELNDAQRSRKAFGEARAARDRDNTYHARKCKLAHLTGHLPQELWAAFLAAALARVKACSERAVLGSLLLGFLVRDLFTLHAVGQLDAHGQPVYTNIPVSAAAIPDLSCRNLCLQLCRGLPGAGANTRPSAAAAAVLAAHPDLLARLEARTRPSYHSDTNMVDHVGKQRETVFSNMLTLLFAGRLKKSVFLAGAKVLLGTEEYQRRFGFRGLGGGHLPAWSKRQCTYVRRMVCGMDVSWLLEGGVVVTPAVQAEVALQQGMLGLEEGDEPWSLGAITLEPAVSCLHKLMRCLECRWSRHQRNVPAAQACMSTRRAAADGQAHGRSQPAEWLGVDPGKTNMATVAHEERSASGTVVSVCHRTLTAAYYRDSGITRQAQATKTWLAQVKPQPKALSQVNSRPSSLASYRRFADTVLATCDTMWAEVSKPRWANAKFWLYSGKQRVVARFWDKLIKQAKQRWPDRILALAYGAAGFDGSGTVGCRGVPVSQMLKEAVRQFPAGRVEMLKEAYRTSRVSSAYRNPCEALPGEPPESFRWLRPVYSEAKRSQVRGFMFSTSNNIRFYDRDVSAALNTRRRAVGPGPRSTELC
ncbi:hypothetical protein QJQ45_028214, partial [Haematococcus lacustris]